MEEGNGRAAPLRSTRKFHCFHSIPWARRYTTTEAIFSSIELGATTAILLSFLWSFPSVGATRHRHQQLALQQQWAMGAGGRDRAPAAAGMARAFGL